MNAPIVLFVYNRVDHTKNIITSLSKCPEAKTSELFIFSDGPKNDNANEKVQQVRRYINLEEISELFGKVTIIESSVNKGLANSVISGVTQVINKFGKVIVVEDDNIVAPSFLRFMNDALDFYGDNKRIWSIGGYCLPIAIPSDYHHDVFVMDRGSSYAWATWKNRWDIIDWEIKDFNSFMANGKLRRAFNKSGDDRCYMLEAQMKGRIDSWAIRFTYNAFMNNMLFVLPIRTLVSNNGNDGSGIHVNKSDFRFDVSIDLTDWDYTLENVELNPYIQKQIAALFHVPVTTKIKRKLSIFKRIKK